jgi:hypothetical protein
VDIGESREPAPTARCLGVAGTALRLAAELGDTTGAGWAAPTSIASRARKPVPIPFDVTNNIYWQYDQLSAGAAMPIRSFIQPGAFEPEVIAAMSEVLEAALKELQDTGQPNVAPEVIAGRIIAAAKLGERDPVRLREAALRKPD